MGDTNIEWTDATWNNRDTDDAILLVPVTSSEVVARVRVYYTEHGYDFDQVPADDPEHIGVAAAEDLRLWWDDAWLEDNHA